MVEGGGEIFVDYFLVNSAFWPGTSLWHVGMVVSWS